ncbi:MAG TPA: ankyrin repeat domain-containing protein, partial [Candidatus Sulfotelmatobacter sp.]|nr:ankyrin repeat domain-containing protein [Candidatus Sulfotelmatobacter sp.]
ANPNLADSDGNTPVHYALGQKPILELLLAHKADVTATNKAGETPLHWAANAGLKDAAELLLAHGAEVNARDNNGSTPLHAAVFAGKKDLVDLLLASKANPSLPNKNGKVPLDLANSNQPVVTKSVAPGVTLTMEMSFPSPVMPYLPSATKTAIATALKEHGAVEKDIPRQPVPSPANTDFQQRLDAIMRKATAGATNPAPPLQPMPGQTLPPVPPPPIGPRTNR